MRLKKEEIETIKSSVKLIDENAKVYLFGSRVNDNLKGGDIDILIISQTLQKKSLRKVRRDFFNRFGEQRFDIIIDDGNFDNPFTKKIKDQAVQL